MTLLYAHPYDLTATGFMFNTTTQYEAQVKKLRNDYGEPVEEFEIQFVDGENIDAEFANAFALNQGTFRRFLELVEDWGCHEKVRFIIAVGECGYAFDIDNDDIDQLDVDIYEEDIMQDLALRFVEDGLFGEVPESFQFYIDYDAIARDLAVEYSETEIAGQRLIYRCG